jgi:hypothetical protein
MGLQSTKNRAFRGAYRRGQRAAEQGLPRNPPYPDFRTGNDAVVTFSRAFRGYWLEGYDDTMARLNGTTLDLTP